MATKVAKSNQSLGLGDTRGTSPTPQGFSLAAEKGSGADALGAYTSSSRSKEIDTAVQDSSEMINLSEFAFLGSQIPKPPTEIYRVLVFLINE